VGVGDAVVLGSDRIIRDIEVRKRECGECSAKAGTLSRKRGVEEAVVEGAGEGKSVRAHLLKGASKVHQLLRDLAIVCQGSSFHRVPSANGRYEDHDQRSISGTLNHLDRLHVTNCKSMFTVAYKTRQHCSKDTGVFSGRRDVSRAAGSVQAASDSSGHACAPLH